jgi:histidyl-tRNA synthetase
LLAVVVPFCREKIMSELQPARGTHDLIGEDQRRHSHVAETARHVAAGYGFDEWTTPTFEDTRVFSRTLGENSDVVMKEMYSFEDRGGESITLRPEGIAGVCRGTEGGEGRGEVGGGVAAGH